MKEFLQYILIVVIMLFMSETLSAQSINIREVHKVKRKETIFGIAKSYGITIEELMAANPEMHAPGYELKKGMKLKIPFKQEAEEVKAPTAAEPMNVEKAPIKTDARRREVRLGVMLPFKQGNKLSEHMIEYYRGVLMACDSLKLDGISVDIHAWDVNETSSLQTIISDDAAKKCDLIIGPYFTKHLSALAEFANENEVKILMPFANSTKDVFSSPCLFQVQQEEANLNTNIITKFLDKFSNHHVVFVDCNDPTSTKGTFTKELRTRLGGLHRSFNITNLNSKEEDFSKAFSLTSPNVVVLNTQNSAQLNIAFAKLSTLMLAQPDQKISMFGYTEWMNYTNFCLDNFYKFDTYIPSTFYLNPISSRTARILQKYRWNFQAEMSNELPRYAITGFDHAYYFIKGLKMYGKDFDGRFGSVGYTPIQTPLGFEKYENGGYLNKSILFVHYTPGYRIETTNY